MNGLMTMMARTGVTIIPTCGDKSYDRLEEIRQTLTASSSFCWSKWHAKLCQFFGISQCYMLTGACP